MGWRSGVDEPTRDSGLGFHVAALDVSRLSLVGASNLPAMPRERRLARLRLSSRGNLGR
jgi:hypothetical protein